MTTRSARRDVHQAPEGRSPAARRAGLLIVTTIALALAAAGCAATPGGGTEDSSAATALPENTIVIDVRTGAEYDEIRLEGAVNIPVELPDFGTRIATLDPDKTYLVYCRSGRRADIAVDQMTRLGLDATNLGSVDQAAQATGVPTTR